MGAKTLREKNRDKWGEIEIGHKKDGTETPRKEAKMERRGVGGTWKEKKGEEETEGRDIAIRIFERDTDTHREIR